MAAGCLLFVSHGFRWLDWLTMVLRLPVPDSGCYQDGGNETEEALLTPRSQSPSFESPHLELMVCKCRRLEMTYCGDVVISTPGMTTCDTEWPCQQANIGTDVTMSPPQSTQCDKSSQKVWGLSALCNWYNDDRYQTAVFLLDCLQYHYCRPVCGLSASR